DQIRVFTWNQKKERYETAYRERLIGDLPIQVGTQDFGKDGHLPVFALRAKEGDQPFRERKYSLNGVMVRRALAPGETPPAKSNEGQTNGLVPKTVERDNNYHFFINKDGNVAHSPRASRKKAA